MDVKIFKPEITEKDGDICISARVETTTCPVPLPDTLWFRFPQKFSDYISGDINGFAVALLPLAMTLGEDMYLEGALSPRLLRGMEEYQRIQCAWKPSWFRSVSIEAEDLQPTVAASGGGSVGSSFSGGVDSAYTLWRHLPENERNPSYRISHCLMINGFDGDVDLDKSGRFSEIEQAMGPMMDRLGLQLVVCKTNFRAFRDPKILKQTFGAIVAVPALLLGRLFSAFFIPSSFRFDDFFRDGSHLMLDHLIATETLETIHDGSHLKRTQKTEVISRWDETYTTLRVCGEETGYDKETNSIQNCCRCEKCIRTMKTLELYGALEKYKTFPRKLGHLNVWMSHVDHKGVRIFTKEITSEALRTRQWGILIDFWTAIIATYVFKIPKAILRPIHLFIEGRSNTYAKLIRRIYPRLRTKPYMIE